MRKRIYWAVDHMIVGRTYGRGVHCTKTKRDTAPKKLSECDMYVVTVHAFQRLTWLA